MYGSSVITRAFLPAATLLLVSCASTPDRLTPPLRLGLLDAGVDPGTVARIEALEPLGYAQVLDLAEHGVSDPAIVDYLRATGTPQGLAPDDLRRLGKAGAGPSLVNHLADSPDHDDPPGRSQPPTGADREAGKKRIPGGWHKAGFVFDSI